MVLFDKVITMQFTSAHDFLDHVQAKLDANLSFAKPGFSADTEILEIEVILDEMEIARSLFS